MNRRALLLSLPLALAACSKRASDLGPTAGATTVSKVELADVAGIDAALKAQRGKAVLLNFWAMW